MYNNAKASEFIINLRRKISREERDLAFVCIGSNKVVGDMLGPLVGSYLKSNSRLEVFGDLSENICQRKDFEKIYSKVKGKCVIAVDSAVSNYGRMGDIFITNKPLKIAYGINLDKGMIGDISIKGIVAVDDRNQLKNLCNLKNSDADFIKKMAFVIGNGIKESLDT